MQYYFPQWPAQFSIVHFTGWTQGKRVGRAGDPRRSSLAWGGAGGGAADPRRSSLACSLGLSDRLNNNSTQYSRAGGYSTLGRAGRANSISDQLDWSETRAMTSAGQLERALDRALTRTTKPGQDDENNNRVRPARLSLHSETNQTNLGLSTSSPPPSPSSSLLLSPPLSPPSPPAPAPPPGPPTVLLTPDSPCPTSQVQTLFSPEEEFCPVMLPFGPAGPDYSTQLPNLSPIPRYSSLLPEMGAGCPTSLLPGVGAGCHTSLLPEMGAGQGVLDKELQQLVAGRVGGLEGSIVICGGDTVTSRCLDLDLETGASSLALTSTTTALTTGRSVLLLS